MRPPKRNLGRKPPMTLALLLALASIAASMTACSSARSTADSPQPVYPAYRKLAAAPVTAKFADAVAAARAHGLRVWLESDLVERWKAGPASFDSAIAAIAGLAARPGVVGVKIADELGDRDGMSGAQIIRFLRDSRAALHANAPGKLVLIDVIGYELSCAPGIAQAATQSRSCEARERAAHPGVTLATIQQIVDSGYVDVIDLSTDMQDPAVYRSWGITRADAQRAAFAEIHRRGWDHKVRIQTRKALAFPTTRIPDASTAAEMLPDFVDVPMSAGARAVDVWTFNQFYDGRFVHLMAPGQSGDVLWSGLLARHRHGDALFTHYSPTFPLGASVDADMGAIAQAFTDVFIAAGTG